HAVQCRLGSAVAMSATNGQGSSNAAPASLPAWLLARTADLLAAARRRLGISLGVPALGLIAGVIVALVLPSRYPADAAFMPDSEGRRLPLNGGLAGLASQFGLDAEKGDSPQFYAELLRNRTVVLPILAKTYEPNVAGTARPATLASLLDVQG